MAQIVYKSNVRSINVGKDKYLVKDKLNDRSIYKHGDKQMRKSNPDLQIIHGSLALFLSSKVKVLTFSRTIKIHTQEGI